MIARLDGFQEYIYDHVTAKRRDPQDDMVSFLCDVHYEALDRKLTDLEIAGIVHAMIIGGLETTQYALEEQAQLLCEHPGIVRGSPNRPAKLRAFVEESMRMRSPTHGLSTRITAHDEVFQGVEVPAGSLLHLRFGAANVDAGRVRLPVRPRPRPRGSQPPRHVLGRPAGVSGRHPVTPRAADRVGGAPRPARFDRRTATATTGSTSPGSCSARSSCTCASGAPRCRSRSGRAARREAGDMAEVAPSSRACSRDRSSSGGSSAHVRRWRRRYTTTPVAPSTATTPATPRSLAHLTTTYVRTRWPPR